jgi:FlaA1/EpsC-like NDP-sugar epimerase
MTLIRTFDLVLVCATFLASLAVSASSLTWPGLAEVLVIRIKVANMLLFVGYLGLCSAVFTMCGLYRSHRLSSWKQRLYEILLAVTLVTAAFLVLHQFIFLEFVNNAFLLVFWLLTVGALMLSHELTLQLLQVARQQGRNLRHIVIVGEGPDADALAQRIRQEKGLGYRILRIIDAREMTEDGWITSDR